MKIAYIVLKGMPLGGGIEKYTEELGSRLVSRGHEVVVYTTSHYVPRNGSYRGMKIITVPSLSTRSLEKISAALTATLWQVREKDVDIVHYHAFGPPMFSFVPRLAGRRVLVQGHGLEWKRSRWGIFGKLFLRATEAPSVLLPHLVTVVSEVQRQYLLDTYGRHSEVIPTGVNPPRMEEPRLLREYGLSGNDYILFAARLVREKGAHYLIDAYKRLETDMKLVIAGDARHEEKYISSLRRLAGDNGKIILPGFVTGKLRDELFSNCYLFVLPSEIEGLPTALLEAMSHGNCCLVSDIPENLEALNGLGYSFGTGDVDRLAGRLRYLIANPGEVERVKEAAQRHVLDNYNWDGIADKFESLYNRLMQR